RDAAAHPALLVPRATPMLIDALAAAAVLDAGTADALRGAHACLLAIGLDCTLDRRPRLAPPGETLAGARDAIREAWRRHGLRA
ncbi:MAG: hypothetical protein KIS84_02045, partial [Dokdonella sp.]|nr:hypothetical protein [Dokdonella sp.]